MPNLTATFSVGQITSLVAMTVLTASSATAAPPTASPVDFNRDIRSILSLHCLKCHGRDQENRQAGLRLDLRDSSTATLESGRIAIVPGQPAKSTLVDRITSRDADLRMPPADEGNPLSSQQIATLSAWIGQGAHYARHWSFIPPTPPTLPNTPSQDAISNPIDRFIQARLPQHGLKPAPLADRETLARRLSLDLRGLPASTDEIDRFVSDRSPGAWDRLIDRFLADPAYGERW
ncbi:MAG: DUF1549 domain-containing protein, partial [Planctomycetota bacterium]|nr:DUF1549 domain-containing protein [Planctomycetota bacterium]